MILVSMERIIDDQQKVKPIAHCLLPSCWYCVYDERLSDGYQVVSQHCNADPGGSYVLDDPLCAFLKTSISLLTTNDRCGIAIRYLDVHGRVLRQDSINGAEELRAGVHRDRRKTSFEVLLLEVLLELELRNSNDGVCAFCIIILSHALQGMARRPQCC
jgi:hypothetical protein